MTQLKRCYGGALRGSCTDPVGLFHAKMHGPPAGAGGPAFHPCLPNRDHQTWVSLWLLAKRPRENGLAPYVRFSRSLQSRNDRPLSSPCGGHVGFAFSPLKTLDPFLPLLSLRSSHHKPAHSLKSS